MEEARDPSAERKWWMTRWPADPWATKLHQAGIPADMVALWFGEQKERRNDDGTPRPQAWVANFYRKENGVVRITVPSLFRKEWIKEKYKNQLPRAFPDGYELVVG